MHYRGIVAAALLSVASAVRLVAQEKAPTAIRLGETKPFATAVTKQAGDADFDCAMPSDVDLWLSHDPVAVQDGKYVVRKIRFDPGRSVSANSLDISCRLAIGGVEKATLTYRVAPPSSSKFRFSLKPDGVAVGDMVSPKVTVYMDGYERESLVVGASVAVKMPWTTSMSAPVLTDANGVAQFPAAKASATLTPGNSQKATVQGVSASKTFDINVSPGPVDKIEAAAIQKEGVGKTFTLTATMHDQSNNAMCATKGVSVQLIRGSGVLRQGTLETKSPLFVCDGETLQVPNLTYFGLVDTLLFRIASAGHSAVDSVAMLPGDAFRLRMVQAPPLFVAGNPAKAIVPKPQVRLEDTAGNGIVGRAIEVSAICVADSVTIGERNAIERLLRLNMAKQAHREGTKCEPPQLSGILSVNTSATGTAQFDTITFVGKQGRHSLCFTLFIGSNTQKCELVNYDIDREFNKGFVVVSAIHTVSSSQKKPANEFFDLRFRFLLPKGLSSTLAADLGIRGRETDSVSGTQRDVMDALALLNWSAPGNSPGSRFMRVTDPSTDALDRLIVLGTQARIFAGVPYAGLHAGSIEMRNSLFFGSMFTVGWVTPLSYLPIKTEDGTTAYPSQHNAVVDLFLRSNELSFLRMLNVRASFLMPFDKGRRVLSRIVIAVPLEQVLKEF